MRLAFRGLPFSEDASGAVLEALACVGQSQPPRGAIEQPRAEPLLQPRDRLGDRCLGQFELLGGERKGAQFGDLGEDGEPLEIRKFGHNWKR